MNKKELTIRLECNELKSLRKQNLPHIDSLQKKLTTIFKYKVKHQEGSRVPQAYS